MKVKNLTLSAIGFASLAAAQNGNDPLILNNRTGLAPVVYDTFSTSYTKLPVNEPASNGLSQVLHVTVPVTHSPVRSNTYFPKSTTSVECWRNGYPCGQNGGQRSQRQVANFVRATPAPIDGEARVENGDVGLNALPVPSQDIHRLGGMAAVPRVPPPEFFSTRPNVHVPGETGDVTMGILPIPTEVPDDTHYDAPPASSSTRTNMPEIPGETSEAIFSILPISTTAPTTEENSVVIPTDWWRGPIQSHTIDCNRHYCPTNTHDVPTFATPLPTTYPIVPPTEPYTTQRPDVPPEVTTPAIQARDAGVPIDWWRGPGQPAGPVEPVVPRDAVLGPIERHTADCSLHYCPSWKSTLVVPVRPTSKTTLSTVGTPTGSVRSSFPAVPPNVSTGA